MLRKNLKFTPISLILLFFTQAAQAEIQPFLQCKSVPNEEQATATVNVTEFWNREGDDPPSGFEISYSYKGPNSLGDLDGAGSSADGTFTLTREEANRAFAMDANGNEIFQFSRKERQFAFGFFFSSALAGGSGYVRHYNGKPLSYGLALSCTRQSRQD